MATASMNRVYLDALRRADEEMAKQEEEILRLTRQVRDLEARVSYFQALAKKNAAAKGELVMGVRYTIFLAEMEIIQRDTGKGLREAFALWRQHADACAVTAGKNEAANASKAGLRAWFADWAAEGFAERVDHLCDCGDADCPSTTDMTYVEGRGFVSRWTLDQEQDRAAAAETVAVAEVAAAVEAAVQAVKKPISWADRVRMGKQ